MKLERAKKLINKAIKNQTLVFNFKNNDSTDVNKFVSKYDLELKYIIELCRNETSVTNHLEDYLSRIMIKINGYYYSRLIGFSIKTDKLSTPKIKTDIEAEFWVNKLINIYGDDFKKLQSPNTKYFDMGQSINSIKTIDEILKYEICVK